MTLVLMDGGTIRYGSQRSVSVNQHQTPVFLHTVYTDDRLRQANEV